MPPEGEISVGHGENPVNKTITEQSLGLDFSLQSLGTKTPSPTIVECSFGSLARKHERSDTLEIQ
jgi:hypothetical protein